MDMYCRSGVSAVTDLCTLAGRRRQSGVSAPTSWTLRVRVRQLVASCVHFCEGSRQSDINVADGKKQAAMLKAQGIPSFHAVFVATQAVVYAAGCSSDCRR